MKSPQSRPSRIPPIQNLGLPDPAPKILTSIALVSDEAAENETKSKPSVNIEDQEFLPSPTQTPSRESIQAEPQPPSSRNQVAFSDLFDMFKDIKTFVETDAKRNVEMMDMLGKVVGFSF